MGYLRLVALLAVLASVYSTGTYKEQEGRSGTGCVVNEDCRDNEQDYCENNKCTPRPTSMIDPSARYIVVTNRKTACMGGRCTGTYKLDGSHDDKPRYTYQTTYDSESEKSTCSVFWSTKVSKWVMDGPRCQAMNPSLTSGVPTDNWEWAVESITQGVDLELEVALLKDQGSRIESVLQSFYPILANACKNPNLPKWLKNGKACRSVVETAAALKEAN